MNKKIGLLISLILVCTIFTAGWFAARAEPLSAPLQVLTQVNTSFSYQGYLEDAGSAAQGAYDFILRLYDDPSAGSQVGGDNIRGDVGVVKGVFTVTLDFGSVFDGRALWLELAVRPGASTGSYTILLPRQLLTGVPYALSLRPGAVIQNTSGTGRGLEVWSNAATHLGTSLWVENDNPTSGIALWGKAQGNDATIISSNTSTGALFKGFGGDGGEHEFIVENNGDLWTDGDVSQSLDARGLAKAGAMVYCDSTSATLYGYFNNVTGGMAVVNGATPGYCYINFGFNIGTRFWIVSNASVTDITLPSCSYDPGFDFRLWCRTVKLDGSSYGGMFNILVY